MVKLTISTHNRWAIIWTILASELISFIILIFVLMLNLVWTQGVTIKGETVGLGKDGLSMASAPHLQQAVKATVDCTALHLKQRSHSLLCKWKHKTFFYHYDTSIFLFLSSLSFYSLIDDGSFSATAKTVSSFKIFSQNSWSEQRDQLTDYAAEGLDFLLDHLSPISTRLVLQCSW